MINCKSKFLLHFCREHLISNAIVLLNKQKINTNVSLCERGENVQTSGVHVSIQKDDACMYAMLQNCP